MKFDEIKKNSKDGLEKMLKDKREKLRQLRLDLASGKVKNIREIRMDRKEIARIKTALNNK